MTGAAAQPQPPQRRAYEKVPVTGKAGPGLERLDLAMLDVMDRHGIPGAAFAFARGGKLLLAKGYGWADVTTGAPAEPNTVFGLASLSKSITAVAALKLVEQAKLGLDDPVLGILKDLQPPRGSRMDPRLSQVTVRQCLNHSGGWDRAVKGDPAAWEPQICRAFRLQPPISPWQFLEFMAGQPLNFDPGTKQIYSNVGYVLLGEIIARLSGRPYHRYCTENVLKPMGITRAGLYAADGNYVPGQAVRCLAGTLVALPALRLPMMDAAGGWNGSVVDMLRFLTNLDGSRGEPVLGEKMRQAMVQQPAAPLRPRDSGTWFGLGWDIVLMKDGSVGYYKEGCYQGMRTFMKRLPSGLNWALLYNASMEFDPQDTQLATRIAQEVRQIIEGHDKYPDVDLFNEFG
jgi:N-acyl-D-amino-acid deacylase